MRGAARRLHVAVALNPSHRNRHMRCAREADAAGPMLAIRVVGVVKLDRIQQERRQAGLLHAAEWSRQCGMSVGVDRVLRDDTGGFVGDCPPVDLVAIACPDVLSAQLSPEASPSFLGDVIREATPSATSAWIRMKRS